MATHLELYDALKPKLGTEAARMLTQELPLREEIATKTDLAMLQSDITALVHKLDVRMTSLESRVDGLVAAIAAESHRLEAAMTRRLHSLILPMWFGVFAVLAGVMVTLVSKG